MAVTALDTTWLIPWALMTESLMMVWEAPPVQVTAPHHVTAPWRLKTVPGKLHDKRLPVLLKVVPANPELVVFSPP